MSHLVQLILEMFGMTRREQFVVCMAMLLLTFALYAGKQFATQKVFATLYLALGLAFCVFMTTGNPRTRMVAGAALCGLVAALFAWYLLTMPRFRPTRDEE